MVCEPGPDKSDQPGASHDRTTKITSGRCSRCSDFRSAIALGSKAWINLIAGSRVLRMQGIPALHAVVAPMGRLCIVLANVIRWNQHEHSESQPVFVSDRYLVTPKADQTARNSKKRAWLSQCVSSLKIASTFRQQCCL